MKLLDTVMDALNSLFPDLIRAPASGSPPGVRGNRGAGEQGVEEGGGFAATLVQFLGGGASVEASPVAKAPEELAGSSLEGGETPGETGDPAAFRSGHELDGTGLSWRLTDGGTGQVGPWGQGAEGSRVELERPRPGVGTKLSEAGSPLEPVAVRLGKPSQDRSPIPGPVEDTPEARPSREPESGPVLDLAEVGHAPDGASTRSGEVNPSAEPSSTEAVSGIVKEPTSGPVDVASPPPISSFASAGPMDRDPGKLDPEFRTRLDRVITRMEQEFGHEVRLVEGYRSPERQAGLYQQGRTLPGPVVTWTEDSRHSTGRAADLQVDGSWDDPRAYARLQRIAEEEGLQTLGAKDAGHVQLPEDGARTPTPLQPTVGERLRERGRSPRPARVATIAAPSRTARVAQVASPARSGPGPGPAEAAPAPPPRLAPPEPSFRKVTEPGTADVARDPRSTGSEGSAQDGPATDRRPAAATSGPAAAPTLSAYGAESRPARPQGDRRSVAAREPSSGASSVEDGGRENSVLSQGLNQRTAASAPEVGRAEGIQRPGTMERVSEIQALEEAMNARTPGRIHLDLMDVDGAGTRLRLSLRGAQLGGSVDLTDPAATLRMRDRVGELHQALARKGLDASALGIQAARGLEGGRGIETDLAALIQDPLAGLTRIMESREGAMNARGDRQGQAGDEPHRGDGRFRDPARKDRNKEDGK